MILATKPETSLVPFTGGKIALAEDQLPSAEQMLARLDFAAMPGREVVRLGFEAEQALNNTLDGFMSRLDKNTAAPVFALFDRLQKDVKDADLDGVLRQIEGAKPGLLDRAVGSLRGKGVVQLAQDALEKVRKLLAGKTKNLHEELVKLEKELASEIAKLMNELNELEKLKLSYGKHLSDFALAAGVTEAFTKKAQEYVERRKLELSQDASQQARSELEELETKLQLLQSRALALEGTYTRLPADQEVIRQIEVAGVSTLGETLTTASSRFASIKMTLLTAHSALAVKGVQNLAAASAELDRNLLAARGKLVKDAAVSAAAAPGENRLAQAAQIQRIVAETAELYQAVDAARKENVQKFESAKRSFEQAREALANLAQNRPVGS
jgi:hypothetical protein